MDKLEGFHIEGDLAVFRLENSTSIDNVTELIRRAIVQTRHKKVGNLLVDIAALSGVASPSIGARYFLVQQWAEAARGVVRVAMVARDEIIDPDNFGVTAAANAGLVANIFADEAEALKWLQDVSMPEPVTTSI